MSLIRNRSDLNTVLEQASKSEAFLIIKSASGNEHVGTIQVIQNGHSPEQIIIESPDLKQYTKVSISEIRQIQSDVLLDLNNCVSQRFDVAPQ